MLDVARQSWTRTYLPLVLALGVLCAVVFCYYAALNGPFLLDDVQSVFKARLSSFNASELMGVVFADKSGIFGRPVSVLSFSINSLFAGEEAYAYKVVNLAIHIITAVLLYLLLVRVLGIVADKTRLDEHEIKLVSIATCAIWLVHPLQVSTVMYVVQRMAMLSTLFSVAGLLVYLEMRVRLQQAGNTARQPVPNPLLLWGLLLICCALAILSKENGFLIFIYILVLEVVLFRLQGKTQTDKTFNLLFAALIVFPILAGVVFFLLKQDSLMAGYVIRGYGWVERLMTQPQIIVYYMKQIFLPDIYDMSLYHDGYPVVREITPRFILSVAFLLVTMIFSVLTCRKYPLICLGLALFLASHLLESTVLPLELIFEHRNYFGVFCLLMPAVVYLFQLTRSFRVRYAFPALMAAAFSLLGFQCYARSAEWSSDVQFHSASLASKPHSRRAIDNWTRILLAQGKLPETLSHLEKSIDKLPEITKFRVFHLMISGALGSTNEPYLEDILARLKTQPIISADVEALKEIKVSHDLKRFTWPDIKAISDLYSAALSNPQKQLKPQAESVIYMHYSDILLDQGRNREALEAIRTSVQLDEVDPDTQSRLLKLQMEVGDANGATRSLKALKRLDVKKEYGDLLATASQWMSKQVVGEMSSDQ